MDGYENEDSESDYSDHSQENYKRDFEINNNTQANELANEYKEQIIKLNSENRNLRRQLQGIKGHLSNDLTKIYEKLRKVEIKQKNTFTKKYDKKINKILKEVEFKMKELENEYRKRLNFYKGHRENLPFIDQAYDRVFGTLESVENQRDRGLEGIYSDTESNENNGKDYFTTPYTHNRNSSVDKSVTPLRVKYRGLNQNNLCDLHYNRHADDYQNKKVRFSGINSSNRSFSYNRVSEESQRKNKTYGKNF